MRSEDLEWLLFSRGSTLPSKGCPANARWSPATRSRLRQNVNHETFAAGDSDSARGSLQQGLGSSSPNRGRRVVKGFESSHAAFARFPPCGPISIRVGIIRVGICKVRGRWSHALSYHRERPLTLL